MSVHAQWYDQTQRILYYEFQGTILWEDYVSALSQGRVMMQSVPHQVCVLNAMFADAHLPEGFVTKVRAILETEPENRGCIVFVSPSQSFVHMMDKVQRIIPKFDEYCFYANSEAEALNRIRDWNNLQARTS